MKNSLFLSLLICQIPSIAQPTFYGVRNMWNGEFVSYNVGSNTSKLLHAIDRDGYGTNFGPLLKASESRWYGSTSAGGTFNGGTLFSFDQVRGEFSRLANFKWPEIYYPTPTMVEADDGRIFGTAYYHDRNIHGEEGGVIYSFDPKSKNLTVEARIVDENVSKIQDGLAYRDGKLYGITLGGSIDEPGILFSFDITQKAFKILYRFSSQFYTPSTGVVFGRDGRLYGILPDRGELYAFDLTTNTFEVVHSFGPTGGYIPKGAPVLASDGKLYGIAWDNWEEGFVYSYDPSTALFNRFDFDFFLTSAGSPVGLVSDADSHLFGYSPQEGLYTFNIESKQIESWNKTKAVNFTDESSDLAFTGPDGIINIDHGNQNWALTKNASTGSYLTSNLLVARNGTLYGRTRLGGVSGQGVLFSFDPTTSSYQVLMDSTLGKRGNMIMGFDQNLYFSTRTYVPVPFTTIDKISIQDKIQSTQRVSLKAENIMQASDSLFYWVSGGAMYSYSITDNRLSKLASIPIDDEDDKVSLVEGKNKTYMALESILM